MAGVTDKGWEPKPFDSIRSDMVQSVEDEWGTGVPTSPDAVLGQILSIMSAAIKDGAWDLGNQIEDSQNRDTAEGIYLDYLAAEVGITRQQASGATGAILFTGESGTEVVLSTACKDQTDNVVITTEAAELNRSNSYNATFGVHVVADNTDYTIEVEGTECTFTSGLNSTEDIILQGLAGVIESNTVADAEFNESDKVLVVSYPSANNNLSTVNSSNLSLVSLGVLVQSVSAEVGDINIYKDTVTKLVTPNLGIMEVNNPAAFTSGRGLESDPELRLRMDLREQSTGTATKPSIEASIAEIEGVTSVLVLANRTLIDDGVTGVKKKSFETFVAGGDSNAIAEVIWETQPATGNTVGDIHEIIVDKNGDSQGVYFSRPYTEFAWVRVTYDINDEESFPVNGEEDMRDVVVAYGDSMNQGDDFDGTKFYGPLYGVKGIWVSKIEIATTTTEAGVPTYQESRIDINDVTSLSFDSRRVTITT